MRVPAARMARPVRTEVAGRVTARVMQPMRPRALRARGQRRWAASASTSGPTARGALDVLEHPVVGKETHVANPTRFSLT